MDMSSCLVKAQVINTFTRLIAVKWN